VLSRKLDLISENPFSAATHFAAAGPQAALSMRQTTISVNLLSSPPPGMSKHKFGFRGCASPASELVTVESARDEPPSLVHTPIHAAPALRKPAQLAIAPQTNVSAGKF
jgi:hypothetical protein